jgi:sec-independent protein translocase protein TatB
MFGIGMPELILIAALALIVLGPKKLPDLAKSMGRAVREFRKATSELKETLQVDSEFSEVKNAFNDFQSDVNKTIQSEAKAEAPPAGQSQTALDTPGAGSAPAGPAPGEPASADSADKLDELKKAFQAWNAGPTPASPPPSETPTSPSGQKPATDKPRSG